jgi:DNA-binding GntR family transcriptional regulator
MIGEENQARLPSDPSSPVAPATRTLAAYESLRHDIVTGILAPGAKLKIESMCDRYGAGSSPIREALNRLYAEGLVSLHEQRGFRVRTVSVDELQDLARTRCLVNEIGVREAIARGDAKWEEGIVLAFHRLMRARKELKENPGTYLEMERRHREFHAAIISGCGSRWLCAFADVLFDLAGRYRHLARAKQGMHRDTNSEHRAIMDAVIERDSAAAINLLTDHMMRGAEALRDAVLTAEAEAPDSPAMSE